jgi:hypothetical protein
MRRNRVLELQAEQAQLLRDRDTSQAKVAVLGDGEYAALVAAMMRLENVGRLTAEELLVTRQILRRWNADPLTASPSEKLTVTLLTQFALEEGWLR